MKLCDPPAEWARGEWLFFAGCFGLLLLHPLLNGYPFLFGDSWAYCCECPDSTRSPVLGCALRPVVSLVGVWGYVLVQCAAAAYAFTVLAGPVFGRRHRVALVAAIVVSGAGIFAGLAVGSKFSAILVGILMGLLTTPLI